MPTSPSLPITFTSPLPATELWLETLNATAGLSTLGEMQLGLLSPSADIAPDELLGKPVTVSITLRDGAQRPLHGYVTRFGNAVHRGGRHVGYQAIVRPWLWFLTRTSNCRIFQEMTVPDIVKQVFQGHRIASVDYRLFRSYRSWNYCVQYRESDYNFVARLLEHEGIYWYFEHLEDKHQLVLVDSLTAHDPAPGNEELPYYEHTQQAPPDIEHMQHWRFSREVRSGRAALTSYDFARPSTDLSVQAQQERAHDLSDYEVFDFQGDYAVKSEAEQWVEDRIDELQTGQQLMHGRSNAHSLEVGRLFSLTLHPREDQNARYLITALSIAAHAEASESSDDAGFFRCELSAMPAEQQYRPSRITPKPCMQGPQTAEVVGPAGEEIFTDAHGRVKLQFHWDRYGKRDENSSCWIRVSHPWAGKGWGAVSIPRIGQEVVVDFLEGDPDQPLVTGRVYNGEQNAPYPLPDGAVVSGIKSNTHKGSGHNEMCMDDTAGKEKINIHAQYDMSTKVLHDQTLEVKNNRSGHIVVDDTLNVDANRTLHVKGKLAETIDSGHELTVTAGYTQTLSGGATSTINGGLTSTVNGGETRTVNGGLTSTVNGGQTSTFNDKWDHTVNGPLTEHVTGAIKQTGDATIDITATGAGTYSSDAKLTFTVGGSVIEIAPAGITLSLGGSVIKIDAAGVAVTGPKISLNG